MSDFTIDKSVSVTEKMQHKFVKRTMKLEIDITEHQAVLLRENLRQQLEVLSDFINSDRYELFDLKKKHGIEEKEKALLDNEHEAEVLIRLVTALPVEIDGELFKLIHHEAFQPFVSPDDRPKPKFCECGVNLEFHGEECGTLKPEPPETPSESSRPELRVNESGAVDARAAAAADAGTPPPGFTMEQLEAAVFCNQPVRRDTLFQLFGWSKCEIERSLKEPGCKVKSSKGGWLRIPDLTHKKATPAVPQETGGVPVVDAVVKPSRGAEGNGTDSPAEGKAQALPVGDQVQLSPTLNKVAMNGPAPSAGADDLVAGVSRESEVGCAEAANGAGDPPASPVGSSNQQSPREDPKAEATDAIPAAHTISKISQAIMEPEENDNTKLSPTDAGGVRLGKSIPEPFSATDLRARLDGPADRCYAWIAAWKGQGWIQTVGFNIYNRLPHFGQ